METSNDPARMRLVGGNLALDFVNTRTGPPDGPPSDDVLGDVEGLLAWARYVGLADDAEVRRLGGAAAADPVSARRAFRRARILREALDRLLRSVALGEPPPGAARSALRDAAADAIGRADLVPGDSGYEWSWAGDRTLAGLLGPVVQSAVDLLTSGQLDRVKACGGCRFLFLDESKNRSRRWCSMDDCGTAEKMRRYVRRRAAKRS